MKKIVLLLAVQAFCLATSAQDEPLTGHVVDTTTNTPIALAAIAVLNEKDSILQTFTRSDKHGNFRITGLPDGNYILLIGFPKYGDYVDEFSVKNGRAPDIGMIPLMPAARLLDEIVIHQSPILIKGDTTIYLADSFKVRENASVEELLKELPGIQVDKDGKITAQGKQVQKVLVDGDEFFSDDPTVATRNLRADAISRVQVFDKKSDQAAFTGIDDGKEVKTIDLKLKENAKKGYFGKASAAGLDKYYNATAMLNAFKAKRKLSVFGVASSTKETGLNFNDQRSLGFNDPNSSISFEDGGITVTRSFGGNSLGAGSFYGDGLPESIKAGAHYSDKWKEGKNSAGGDYLFNKLDTRTSANVFSQNTLFDSVYYNRSSSNSNSSRLQHNLNGVMELNLDSTSQITVRAYGNTGRSNSYATDRSEALSETLDPVNKSLRTTTNNSDYAGLNTSVFYRKRFKKKGRSMSANLTQNYNDSKGSGLLDNVTTFFDESGSVIKESLTDQNKVNETKNQTSEARLSYTNPVTKNSFIELNYSFNKNNNYQKRLSYQKDGSGKYDELIDSLSSDFKYTYHTNTGGVSYLINNKKLNINGGVSVSHTGAEQQDHFADTTRTYSYTNLFPRATLRYKFTNFSSLSLNYNGSTSQPTIDQIQPLKNNDDPLNIVIGNPDLTQSFRNNISLNYNSFQMLTEQYVFVGVSFSTISDQISSSYTIDSLGQRVTQYINVDGNYFFNLFGSWSRKLGKTWRVSISPNGFFSQTRNFVNKKENISRSLRLNPSVSISKRDVKLYEANVRYRPSYNSSKSSISSVASQDYWTHNMNLSGRYTLPFKIDIGTDIEYEGRQKINAADTKNTLVLWNAYIEKRFLKKETLSLRFSMHDLLNQNKGYERVIQPTAVIERNYLTFQRYGLITLTYNFNSTGAPAKPQGPIIRF